MTTSAAALNAGSSGSSCLRALTVTLSSKNGNRRNSSTAAGGGCNWHTCKPGAEHPCCTKSADLWRAVCVKIIALLMWIWIKCYPRPHRPDACRLCQNYSTIHVDMDKIGFIHIHTDEVRAVCVKIIALPIWIWIKFYPCPHRREARRACQNSQNEGLCEYIIGHTTWEFHMLLFSYISYAAAFVRKRHA